VRRALARGIDLFKVLQVATAGAVNHYGLSVGLLREGDPADLIRVDSLEEFNVLQTYIDGQLVAEQGRSLIAPVATEPVNNFHAERKRPSDFRVEARGRQIRAIEAVDGELITNSLTCPAPIENDEVVADVARDLLKISVVNRYQNAPVSVGFVKNFGFKDGALASSVAHDSHNIIAVGTQDQMLCRAVNLIIEHQGGMAAVSRRDEKVLPLPVAGLMSDQDGYAVGRTYRQIDGMAKDMGSPLRAPLMTLSFMGLLVIPSLKLSDRGLFDGNRFQFTSLWG
jgi:adenine deaminase